MWVARLEISKPSRRREPEAIDRYRLLVLPVLLLLAAASEEHLEAAVRIR